jgi:hypothetical protein
MSENQTKKTTNQQFDEVISESRIVFQKKLEDYGPSWRVLRKESVLDQLFIKLSRIRNLQDGISQQVNSIGDDIVSEFKGVLNYGIIALIQDACNNPTASPSESVEEIMTLYDQQTATIKELMQRKNHDYGEAWRSMCQKSFVDLALTKLFRIKQIYNNNNQALNSEPASENYKDICNYTVFALILIYEQTI